MCKELNPHCDLNQEGSNPKLCMLLQLIMMFHHAKFACNMQQKFVVGVVVCMCVCVCVFLFVCFLFVVVVLFGFFFFFFGGDSLL